MDSSNLEKLRERLYKKGETFVEREGRSRIYEAETDNAASYWRPEIKKTEMKNKFFIISLIFLFLAIAGAAVYFFLSTRNAISSKNIDIGIKGPVFVDAGGLVDFDIFVKNKNNAALETADLIIEFPDGSFSDEGVQLTRERFELGKIEAGGEITDALSAAFFGLEDETKEINFIIEYRVAESNAIFEKSQKYSFKISKAPFGVSVSLPKEVNSRQELDIKVQIVSNSESAVKNLFLQMEYPAGFQFLSATPAPSEGNAKWFLGDIGRSQKKEIIIKGMIEGQDLEEKSFNALVGVFKEDDFFQTYAKSAESFVIKKPSLNLAILVNGQDAEKNIVNAGSPVKIELRWVNNLPVNIRDISIELEMNGNSVDEKTISINDGFYRTFDKKIIWNSSSLKELASIKPGETGKTQFSFYIKNPLPIYGSADKNFTIELSAKISGTGTYEEFENKEISDTVVKEIKAVSQVQLAARALHYSGPISNSGPMPPQVGKETTYSISWSLGNNSDDLSGVKVSAFLPPYVRWLDIVSPDTDLKFEEKEGILVWNIGNLSSGTGIVSPAKEVTFKIGFTPSMSHVGFSPILVGGTKLEAKDDFTQDVLFLETKDLNIMLVNDPGFKNFEGNVKE